VSRDFRPLFFSSINTPKASDPCTKIFSNARRYSRICVDYPLCGIAQNYLPSGKATYIREYLRDFAPKFNNIFGQESGVWRVLIDEKLRLKISWHGPFNMYFFINTKKCSKLQSIEQNRDFALCRIKHNHVFTPCGIAQYQKVISLKNFTLIHMA
jgi:hypothetical protein